ncbi:hypothetical protein J3E74DRAFT_423108 [Bipolaris maydis]|nr:hypothetical protein J3E74DRAFT_423108 [Bipolaris maydis]
MLSAVSHPTLPLTSHTISTRQFNLQLQLHNTFNNGLFQPRKLRQPAKDELREIAAKGGHASHGSSHDDSSSNDHPGRNPDGTFTKGSEVAKELGAQGGHASHGSDDSGSTLTRTLRNPDGTFKKGSELCLELGAQGGHASH